MKKFFLSLMLLVISFSYFNFYPFEAQHKAIAQVLTAEEIMNLTWDQLKQKTFEQLAQYLAILDTAMRALQQEIIIKTANGEDVSLLEAKLQAMKQKFDLIVSIMKLIKPTSSPYPLPSA